MSECGSVNSNAPLEEEGGSQDKVKKRRRRSSTKLTKRAKKTITDKSRIPHKYRKDDTPEETKVNVDAVNH